MCYPSNLKGKTLHAMKSEVLAADLHGKKKWMKTQQKKKPSLVLSCVICSAFLKYSDTSEVLLEERCSEFCYSPFHFACYCSLFSLLPYGFFSSSVTLIHFWKFLLSYSPHYWPSVCFLFPVLNLILFSNELSPSRDNNQEDLWL